MSDVRWPGIITLLKSAALDSSTSYQLSKAEEYTAKKTWDCLYFITKLFFTCKLPCIVSMLNCDQMFKHSCNFFATAVQWNYSISLLLETEF